MLRSDGFQGDFSVVLSSQNCSCTGWQLPKDSENEPAPTGEAGTARTVVDVSILRGITAIGAAAFALLWTDQVVPGILLASAAFALSLPGLRQPRPFDIAVLVFCALTLQAYTFVHFEYWRTLILGLAVRLNSSTV